MSAIQSTKNCTKCKRVLPYPEFHRDAKSKYGLALWCKECVRTANRKWKQRKQREDPEWYGECLRSGSAWRRTDAGKSSSNKYNEENKEKVRAHNAVRSAVRSGKMLSIESRKCEVCGAAATEYHHNLGYAVEHQLDVQPLCRLCHCAAHSELKLAAKSAITTKGERE